MPAEPHDTHFDLDEVFGQDYLDFYAAELRDGCSDEEAELIAMLADIEAGDRVLDLPCGHGRIARRLAQRGAVVTGIDRSELFLRRARDDAKRHGVDVDFRAGDMRTLAPDASFDVLVNWFTSFGYGTDDELRQILRRMRAALAAGGRLLLETLNVHEPGLTDHETSHVKELSDDAGHHFMIDRTRFDPHDGRLHCRRFVTRSGEETRETRYSLRLFTLPELRSWLLEAGFRDVQAFGADAEVFRVDSRRMILTAR